MKLVNVTELRTRAAEILQFVTEEDVIITYHGEPKAILKSFTGDDWEDYALVHHPDFISQREAARADDAKGKVIDIDTMIKEIEDAEI